MDPQDNTRGRLFLYLFGGLVIVLAIALGVVYFYKSSKVVKPSELVYTNITDSGLSVVWRTDEESNSKLYIREKGGKWIKDAFYDDRDTELDDEGKVILKEGGETARYTHHVSVGGLKPETEYEIALNGFLMKVTKDKDGHDLASVKTGKMLEELYTPDPAYGKVLYEDSKVPNEGIVFLTVTNSANDTEKSNMLSTYLSDIATWSIDVNNFRTPSLDNRIIINNQNDREKITFWNQDGSKYSQIELPDYDKPAADLLLTEEKKVSFLNESLFSKVSAGCREVPSCRCDTGTACIDDSNWQRFIDDGTSCAAARGNYLVCPEAPKPNTAHPGEVYVIPSEPIKVNEYYDSELQSRDQACEYYSNREQLLYYEKDGSPSAHANYNNGRYRKQEPGCCISSGKCVSAPDVAANTRQEVAQAQSQVVKFTVGQIVDPTFRTVTTSSGNQISNLGNTRVVVTNDGQGNISSRPLLEHFNMTNYGYCKDGTEIGSPCLCLTGQYSGSAFVIDSWDGTSCNLAQSANLILQNQCKIGTDWYLPGPAYEEVRVDTFKVYTLQRNLGNNDCIKNGEQIVNSRPDYPKLEERKTNYVAPPSSRQLLNVLGRVNAQSTTNTDSIKISSSGKYVTYMGNEVLSEFTVVVNEGQTANVKLFADLNANGVKDADEPEIEDYTQIQIEQEASAVGYNLQSGWNLINFPLVSNKGIVTASDLIEYFNAQGANIVHVAKYTDAGFVMYSKREDGVQYANDFNLLPGQSYFVLNYTAKAVAFEGNKFAEPVPLKFNNGWNLVGVISPGKSYTANSLLDAINNAGFKASTVSNYEAGRYTSVIKESGTLYGNDYKVLDTKGYFIRVEEGGGSSFTP